MAYVTNDRIINYLQIQANILSKDTDNKISFTDEKCDPQIKEGVKFSNTLLVRSNVITYMDGFICSELYELNGVLAKSTYINGSFTSGENGDEWNGENIAKVEASTLDNLAKNILHSF